LQYIKKKVLWVALKKELIESARENFSKNRSFDRSYHSMRSISQFCVERGERGSSVGPSNNTQINGTQSLNRNLASRSTGAILVPTTNVSSTMSSNSSAMNQQHQQQFQNFNQNNLSSSSHHISYAPNESNQQQIYGGSARVSAGGGGILQKNESQVQGRSATSLNKQQQNELQSAVLDSRTLDSRHSRDKTLGLSDEDLEEHDHDEQDDTDEEDDKTNAYEIENDQEYQQCTCGQQHENQNDDDDDEGEDDDEDEEEEDDHDEGERRDVEHGHEARGHVHENYHFNESKANKENVKKNLNCFNTIKITCFRYYFKSFLKSTLKFFD
jgi:hypothetical protein